LLDSLDRQFDRSRLIVQIPFEVVRVERTISPGAQKPGSCIHRDESRGNCEIMRPMHGQMTGVELVIKARKRFLVSGHASLGFECDQYVADGGLPHFGKLRQIDPLALVQRYSVSIRQIL
jgi:hypothetical protein